MTDDVTAAKPSATGWVLQPIAASGALSAGEVALLRALVEDRIRLLKGGEPHQLIDPHGLHQGQLWRLLAKLPVIAQNQSE